MPSFGSFSQSNGAGYSVTYNQISPLSLGMGYSYTPLKKKYQISASFYYSSVMAVENQTASGATSTVNVPGEYGGSCYGVYKVTPESRFSYYSGLDLESFSDFNMQSIIDEKPLVIDRNQVYYLTAGVNYKPSFMEKILLKFSFSKSLLTSYSSPSSSGKTIAISGYKMLFFVNYQIDQDWSFNTMLKTHTFTGDNTLSIYRLGIGVSYSL